MPTTQEIPATSPIGRKTPRVDGPLKVTGTAQYTSDFHFPGMLYAVPVEATIANGKIQKLDTAAAEKMPGVRAIFHRENIGKIFRSVVGQGMEGIWEGSMLTIYEESQGVFNLRSVLAQMFGLPKENVRVITKFVGSGFGSKLFPWTHCPLAVAAAKQLGKPVKLVLSRKMMFQSVGHRARTQQRVRLGATPDGKLVSLQHDYVYHRSMLDAHHEDCGESTAFHYSVPNLRVTIGRAKRNVGAPFPMRGPGAVPGLYATESAMNELAEQLKIDPVRLRVLNEPKIDESLGIPFSSRHLLECFELGAEKFGWSKRSPEVRSMKRDGLILGWGMAGCSWIAARFPAEASVELRNDGTARVACGTQDIGTGTYTVLALLTSEKTGVAVEKVEVVLGDTELPLGPVSGGSWATASVVPAVFAAADNAINSLLQVATGTPGSPFQNRKPDDLAFQGGRVLVKAAR